MAANVLGVVDWIVFICALCISIGIGVYHALSGGKQKTTGELLMGNRQLSLLPVALSILVSFQSAILILGTPAEMYTKGTQYYLYTFGEMLACVLAAVVYVPLFYPLKLTSMFQYLELRFKSRAARLTGTVINIISTIIYSGIASFAPSTALEAVSGVPEWASFVGIGFICTLYTLLGGLRAVVWVDAFQSAVMFAGILAICIKGIMSVGGFAEVWQLNDEWDRIDFWNFDPDPTVRHTFWALTIGVCINWVGTFGASQASIQRYCSLKTMKDAKMAVVLNSVGVFLMLTAACLSGVSIFAYYAKKGCDPFTNGDIGNKNQLVPYFVMEALDIPGIDGLFMACLFSGALSTLSTNLSSLSATTWEDIVKPFFKGKSDSVQARVTRGLILLYGVVGVGVTFLVKNLKGTVLQASLSFMGAASGALNGIVILGAFFPCCNWIGAMAGTITSYAVMLWIGIAKYTVLGSPETMTFPTATCHPHNISANTTELYYNTTDYYSIAGYSTTPPVTTNHDKYGIDRFYSLSYLWYSTLGSVICIVIGLVVSFLTGRTNVKDVDRKYLIPIFDMLCCCFPRKLRFCLQCNINHHEVEPYENEELREDREHKYAEILTDLEHHESRSEHIRRMSNFASPETHIDSSKNNSYRLFTNL